MEEVKKSDKKDPKMDLIMNESLAKNDYPAALMAQYKIAKKCSLMAKVMTRKCLRNSRTTRRVLLAGPLRVPSTLEFSFKL